MKSHVDPEARVIEAALKLSSERGWRNVALRDIAKRAQIELSELFEVAPSKTAVLEVLGRRIDREMLSHANQLDNDISVRDMMFDMVMSRLDALEPYRKGLLSIFEEIQRRPGDLLAVRPSILRSMGAILESVGLDSDGINGTLRSHALSLIWAGTFAVWLEDDAEDLAKTMSYLDRQLRRAEALATSFDRLLNNGVLNTQKAT